MNFIKRINKNNITRKRIITELSKFALDCHLIKGSDDYQKFIILGRSRVGSNLLISYLNTHPEIFAMGELFGNNHKQKTIDYRKKQPIEYLYKFGFRKFRDTIKAVGFKIFYYHPIKGESREVWNHLKQLPELKVIHLKRRNILRTHLSNIIASTTDIWTTTAKDSSLTLKEKSVLLTYDECLKAFTQTKDWENHFDKFFEKNNKIDIYYEDLIANSDMELDNILNFLNLKSIKLNSSLIKQNPESLKELIKNYDELKQKFANSEWNVYFED